MKHSKQENSGRGRLAKGRGSSKTKASSQSSKKLSAKGWHKLQSGQGRAGTRHGVSHNIGQNVALGKKSSPTRSQSGRVIRSASTKYAHSVSTNHTTSSGQKKAVTGGHRNDSPRSVTSTRSNSQSPARSSDTHIKVHQSRKDKSHNATAKSIPGSRSSSAESSQSSFVGTGNRNAKPKSQSRSSTLSYGGSMSKQKGRSTKRKSVKADKLNKQIVSTVKELTRVETDRVKDLSKEELKDKEDGNQQLSKSEEDHSQTGEEHDKTSSTDVVFPSVDQDHNYFAFPTLCHSDSAGAKSQDLIHLKMDATDEKVPSSNNTHLQTDEDKSGIDKKGTKGHLETSCDYLNASECTKQVEDFECESGSERAENSGKLTNNTLNEGNKDEPIDALIQTEETQQHNESDSENSLRCLAPGTKQNHEKDDKELITESVTDEEQESSTVKMVLSIDGEPSSRSVLDVDVSLGTKRGRGKRQRLSPASESKMENNLKSFQAEETTEKMSLSTNGLSGRGKRKSSIAGGSPRTASASNDMTLDENETASTELLESDPAIAQSMMSMSSAAKIRGKARKSSVLTPEVGSSTEGEYTVVEGATIKTRRGSVKGKDVKEEISLDSDIGVLKPGMSRPRKKSILQDESSETELKSSSGKKLIGQRGIGENSESESIGSSTAKDRILLDDDALKLGISEVALSQEISGQSQGEDDLGEKADLDSSGSSQSLMDIFKHTIALRQQLAKERQKWQKPEDEDMGATSSTESTFQNAFEALRKSDQLLDSDSLLATTEQYSEESIQLKTKVRRGSKDIKVDQLLSGCRQDSEMENKPRGPAWLSNRRSSGVGGQDLLITTASEETKKTSVDVTRHSSTTDDEKPGSRPHSRRSSLLASGTELIGENNEKGVPLSKENQPLCAPVGRRGPGRPPKKAQEKDTPSDLEQTDKNKPNVRPRRKKSRRGLHFKKMFKSSVPSEIQTSQSENSENSSCANVMSDPVDVCASETTKEEVISAKPPKQKLSREESLVKARMCRGKRKWSKGYIGKVSSSKFKHKQLQVSQKPNQSAEEKCENKDQSSCENVDLQHQNSKESQGSEIKPTTETTLKLQTPEDQVGFSAVDDMPKGPSDTGSETVTLQILEQEDDKSRLVTEVKHSNEMKQDVGSQQSVLAAVDTSKTEGDIGEINENENQTTEAKPDLAKPEVTSAEGTEQMQPHSVADAKSDEDLNSKTMSTPSDQNIALSSEPQNQATENGGTSEADKTKQTTVHKRGKVKRRSELDLLNDVDGSISRRKKSKVYQKAYELYGEKGLFDNALAKTLLGLGKFDAENMSRSRLVEELAQKKGNTDLLNDSSLKLMTRRKQNRYSYLFRKKRRESRPASPAGSQTSLASANVASSQKLSTTESQAAGDSKEDKLKDNKVTEVKNTESKVNPTVTSSSAAENKSDPSSDNKHLEQDVDFSSKTTSVHSSSPQQPISKTPKRKMKPSRPIKRAVDHSKLSGTIEYMVRYCKPCSIQLIDLIKCLDVLKNKQKSGNEDEHGTANKTSEEGQGTVTGLRGRKRKVQAKKSVTSSQQHKKYEESSPPKKIHSGHEESIAFLQNSSSDLILDGKISGNKTHTGNVPDEPLSSQADGSPRRSQRATMRSRYRCLFCRYTCHIRKIMEDHVYNHMNIIPYMCGLCYSIFGTRCGVKVHNRRSHPRHQPVIIKKSEVDETQYYTTVEDFHEKYGEVSSVLPIPADNSESASPMSKASDRGEKLPTNGSVGSDGSKKIAEELRQKKTGKSASGSQSANIDATVPKSAIPIIISPQDNPPTDSQAAGQLVAKISPSTTGSAPSNSQPLLNLPETAQSQATLDGTSPADEPSTTLASSSLDAKCSTASEINIDTNTDGAQPPKRSPIILRIPKIHQWKKDYSESSDEAVSSGESESRTVDDSQSDSENLGTSSEQVTNQEPEAVEVEGDESNSPMLKIVSVCSLAENADSVKDENKTTKEQSESAPTATELLENLNILISTNQTGTDGKLEPDEVWQCLMCDDNTRLYDVMVEHIHNVHKKTYWYACPYCPFGCSQPRFNMYRHMRRTHPQKDDNIFVGIIDGDRYFIKKKIGAGVTGSLESSDPGITQNVTAQLPDTSGQNKNTAQKASDNADSAAKSIDTSKAKVKQDEEPIFTRSESGKKMVKPTAHVAPAIQNKAPVRDTVWSDSQRGATVPVYIADDSTVEATTRTTTLGTSCQDLNNDNSCTTLQSDNNNKSQAVEQTNNSTTTSPSSFTIGEKCAGNMASCATMDVQVTSSTVMSISLAGSSVEAQAMTKPKPPPLIPLGIVEASQVIGPSQTVPPLQRAPASALPPGVLPQPAHQGSPHIIPLQTLATSVTVSMAHIRPNISGPPRPVNTTLPIRSATVQPVSSATMPPKLGLPNNLSEEEEARRAFSVFNISARMRQPNASSARAPVIQPPTSAPPRAHTIPATRPVAQRPAPSPPTTDIEQFKQFQLPPRPRIPPPQPQPAPPPSYSTHIQASLPLPPPPPYGTRHLAPLTRPLPPMAHTGVIRTMPRLSAAPEPPLTPVQPGLRHLALPATVMCQSTAAPRQPPAVPRPAHLNSISCWTCPYCPVPTHMVSKSLVEKHIRNCHPEHRVVYVPHSV